MCSWSRNTGLAWSVIAKPPKSALRCIANYSRISSCMSMLIASSALHIISGGQATMSRFGFFLFRDLLKSWLARRSLIWLCKQFWVWSSPCLDRLEGPGCELQRLDETRIFNQRIQSGFEINWKPTEYERRRFTCCEVSSRGWSEAWHDLAPSKTLIRSWWRKTKYENASNEYVESSVTCKVWTKRSPGRVWL